MTFHEYHHECLTRSPGPAGIGGVVGQRRQKAGLGPTSEPEPALRRKLEMNFQREALAFEGHGQCCLLAYGQETVPKWNPPSHPRWVAGNNRGFISKNVYKMAFRLKIYKIC